MAKYNKTSSSGVLYNGQVGAKADSVVAADSDSTVLKTYAAHIKLDSPLPAPRNSTTRMVGDDFVWYRLLQTKGRGKAVEEAAAWFRNVKRKDYAKPLKDKATHECVVVDDPWNECSYGTEFAPTRSVNRLLDESTVKRVLKESEGKLKRADKPFEKGKIYPSIEWVDETKKRNTAPIKTGFGVFSDPTPDNGMRSAIDKAVERAKKRKRNKQIPLMQELKTEDARLMIRKMRQSGLITRDETKVPNSWGGIRRKTNLDAADRLKAEKQKRRKGMLNGY